MTVGRYQAYPGYNDSRVEWLGGLPANWRCAKLKYGLIDVIAGGTPQSGNEQYWTDSGLGTPWVSIADISISAVINTTMKDVTDEGIQSKSLQVLPNGTLLYSIFASLGKVAITRTEVTTNQAILGLVPGKHVVTTYLKYWLISIERYLGLFSNSNTQNNLNAEIVGNIPLYLPVLSEQTIIANFLDHETAKIDTLIDKQQQLIKLLKEKRQAVISHAVTKGLNPAAPMKNSGVEWLGEVPEHWDRIPLKHLVSAPIIDGPHVSPEKRDEGVPFISAEAVGKGFIDFEKKWGYISEEDHSLFSKRYSPEVDDILIIKLGATTGIAAIVETRDVFSIWVPLAAIRCKKTVSARFVFNVLMSSNVQDAIRLSWTFGTQQTLGLGTLENLFMPIPPLAEQQNIAIYLEQQIPRYELLVKRAEESVELLRERRTALISAAVTGKIDVRNWQPAPSELGKEG